MSRLMKQTTKQNRIRIRNNNNSHFYQQTGQEADINQIGIPILHADAMSKYPYRQVANPYHECTYTVDSVSKDVIVSPRHKSAISVIEEELSTASTPLIPSITIRNPRESSVWARCSQSVFFFPIPKYYIKPKIFLCDNLLFMFRKIYISIHTFIVTTCV